MPVAMAMMGAAMAYATGTTGAMEAFGIGSALKSGMEEYLPATEASASSDGADQLTAEAEKELKGNEEYTKNQTSLTENKKKLKENRKNLRTVNSQISSLAKNLRADPQGEIKTLDDYIARRDRIEADKASGKILPNTAEGKKLSEEERHLRSLGGDDLYDKIGEREELEKNQEELLGEQQKLLGEQNTLRNEAIEKAQKSLKKNGSETQVQNAAQDLLKKCQVAIAVQKGKLKVDEDGEVDMDQDFQLSEDEIRSAERMQKSIMDLVDRTVIDGGGTFKSADFVSEMFDGGGSVAQNLASSIDQYQFQRRASEYNASKKIVTSNGGEGDRFDSEATRKAKSRITGTKG